METAPQPEEQRQNSGCGTLLVYGLLVFWILLSTVGAQFFSWLVDEIQFEGLPPQTHWTHLIVTAVYGGMIALPMLLLSKAWKKDQANGLFLQWGLAGLFCVFVALIGIAGLTNAQMANLCQILGAAVYMGALALWQRKNLSPGSNRAPWPLALLVGGLFSLPWVAWGALGSPVDLILNLAAAFALGAAAAMTLQVSWRVGAAPVGTRGLRSILATGGVIALTLLIMATGYGTVGTRIVLALVVLPLGWVIAALEADERGSRGWIYLAVLIALVAALPLAFLDPDELAIVVGGGSGELIAWAERIVGATWVAALVAIFLVIALGSRRQAAIRYAALVVWVAAAAIYILVGQPGFFGERLFVVMKDQADVSQAASIGNIDERRTFVYSTLVSQAQKSQGDLWSTLDRFGIAYTPYYLVNGLEVNGGPLLRLWLNNRAEVDRVLDSPILRPLPETPPESTGTEQAPQSPAWNLTSIGADRVWNELGVRGEGIVVGQSDSGAQGDHVELADSYRGKTAGDERNWFDPWNRSTSPQDIGGHGTHTLGSIVGNTVGVAPDATWIGCVNLARNLGNPAHYLDCMQFMLAPFPQDGNPFTDGDPSMAADVLNNSWGCPEVEGCDPQVLQPAVDSLSAAGIFVVASAGNEGIVGCGSVSDPIAIYEGSYSVGAVDSSGSLAVFSSLGPVTVDGSNRVKPNIVAPGVGVLSSFPGSTYASLDGTSMAGPHVAGVVALMWSANPALIGNIDRTEEILDQTADAFRGSIPACVDGQNKPNDAVGWGVVNAYQAVRMAQND
ncbi:MAG TPA: S8 family serine peptidase [Anaerolineaceae bacterium]|nr:S8 family serine peptidase [Anaerolineaceae bacterium]